MFFRKKKTTKAANHLSLLCWTFKGKYHQPPPTRFWNAMLFKGNQTETLARPEFRSPHVGIRKKPSAAPATTATFPSSEPGRTWGLDITRKAAPKWVAHSHEKLLSLGGGLRAGITEGGKAQCATKVSGISYQKNTEVRTGEKVR